LRDKGQCLFVADLPSLVVNSISFRRGIQAPQYEQDEYRTTITRGAQNFHADLAGVQILFSLSAIPNKWVYGYQGKVFGCEDSTCG
jgi:hypothetical protein